MFKKISNYFKYPIEVVRTLPSAIKETYSESKKIHAFEKELKENYPKDMKRLNRYSYLKGFVSASKPSLISSLGVFPPLIAAAALGVFSGVTQLLSNKYNYVRKKNIKSNSIEKRS